MNDIDITKVAAASAAVMAALQDLNQEERSRVIHAAAVLFGVAPGPASAATQSTNARRDNDGGVGVTPLQGKKISLVEFIKEKQPSTNPQKIACFAYFREKIEGVADFSRGDLSEYFAKAKLPAPGKNYARDYNNAVREAWIHDQDDKSYLTQEGERAVEAGFSGTGSRRGSTAGKKRKKAGKSE
jgi:hypothetical protein